VIILGIDQSYTSCGIVVRNTEIAAPIHVQIATSEKSDNIFTRALAISDAIQTTIAEYPADVIVLEDLAFGSIGNATRQLAGLQYVIITNIKRSYPKIPIHIVPPTTLKKFATGSGKSKKPQMYESLPDDIKALFTTLGIKKKNIGDVTDAYWLSQYIW
jgi:Holliday junction resolvasome RuvABC endonuclease subunit